MQTGKSILRVCSSELLLQLSGTAALHPVSSQAVTRLTLLINTHTVSSDDSNWWVQPPQDPDLFKGPRTQKKEKGGRRQTGLGLSVSGKLLSLTARLSSLLSAGSRLLVLQPPLLSYQVSHCLCLWPWQTAQVSHSGFSAPSGTSALSLVAHSWRDSTVQYPLSNPAYHTLWGLPCGVYSLSIGPELRDSANGQMILLSLWMLIITRQLLCCYFCHDYDYFCCMCVCQKQRTRFVSKISDWVWWAGSNVSPQRMKVD